jgi:CheY-like chemotaxis protein
MGSQPGAAPAAIVDIFLADDDEDDRELFEEAIARISPHIRVKAISDGMQLLEKLERDPSPQMIFLDLNMPGKNGRECLTAIRARAEWQHIPVVIYSTSANKNDIRETYVNGASLYMKKPSSFLTLVGFIRKAFSIDLESERVPEKDFVLSNA